jgi:ABC-type phosphate/phosphonate transport system permease subunit
MQYTEVSAILIAILVMVTGVDAIGAGIRRALK